MDLIDFEGNKTLKDKVFTIDNSTSLPLTIDDWAIEKLSSMQLTKAVFIVNTIISLIRVFSNISGNKNYHVPVKKLLDQYNLTFAPKLGELTMNDLLTILNISRNLLSIENRVGIIAAVRFAK
jgi:hypothetical protein